MPQRGLSSVSLQAAICRASTHWSPEAHRYLGMAEGIKSLVISLHLQASMRRPPVSTLKRAVTASDVFLEAQRGFEMNKTLGMGTYRMTPEPMAYSSAA